MGLHDMTFRDVVQKYSLHFRDRTAFVQGERRWSFGEYVEDLNRLAAGLASLGIRKGDRAAVLSLNSYTYFVIYDAAACLGAVLVPLNWRSKPEELRTILELCTPRVMVAEPEFAEMLAELREGCGFVEHWLSTEETKGFESLAALMKTGGRTEEIPLALEDPYLIVPTAAVEGKPKGAVLTHGNTVAMGILPQRIKANSSINLTITKIDVQGDKAKAAVDMKVRGRVTPSTFELIKENDKWLIMGFSY